VVMSFARFLCSRGAWRCTNLTRSPAHNRESVTCPEPKRSSRKLRMKDEGNVVDDCLAGQRAHFQQILPKRLGTELSRSRLAC
jgi:hypothetical protein